MMATLLLSQGTPMILAGDEFGRTQGGNNNAYCQDSEISWLHWDLKEKSEELLRFTRRLTGLRHKYPVLRHSRFLTAEYNEDLGCKELTWVNAGGHEMTAEEWGRRQYQVLRHADRQPRPAFPACASGAMTPPCCWC